MRTWLCLTFLFLSNRVLGQWQVVVQPWLIMSGNQVVMVPLGSSPIQATVMFGYPNGWRDTNIRPILVRQDSLFGHGFSPAKYGPTSFDFGPSETVRSYALQYIPKYEDTSKIIIDLTSEAPPYEQKIALTAITYIAPSNQYYISRSAFGVLPPRDTSMAAFRLINRTLDSEVISYVISGPADFSVTDSLGLPLTLSAFDSSIPLRVTFQARPERPIVLDTLTIIAQRIRDGKNYGSPIIFRQSLSGGCAEKYLDLSTTQFGIIRTSDSSVALLRLYNPSDSSETARISSTPFSDFDFSEGGIEPVKILPHDSSRLIRVVMHASIDRKRIHDTLMLSLLWDTVSASLPIPVFGGCSDFRFALDTTELVKTTIGHRVMEGVPIRNLCKDTIELHAGDLNHNYFFSKATLMVISVPPRSTVFDSVIFDPYAVGFFEARQSYADGVDSGVWDVGYVRVSGIVSPLSVNSNGQTVADVMAYPNPFSHTITVAPVESGVVFAVYNSLGVRVFTSKEGQQSWDGRMDDGSLCPSGCYLLALKQSSGNRFIHLLFEH